MIDFSLLRAKHTTIAKMCSIITPDLLKVATITLYDHILDLLSGCCDADVTFEPLDPNAIDPYTQNPEELSLPWTLGHVIVHINASIEESAFLAAELARGVEFHGRSRYEVPWREVTTIAQCRSLLEESRVLCLASLEMWPKKPHYETTYCPWASSGLIDARGRFLLGIKHMDDHLEQIREIIRQSHGVSLVPLIKPNPPLP